MESIIGDVFILIMAAAVGIGSAWLTNLIETKRREREADAEWTVTPIPISMVKKASARGWIITNSGPKTATNVELSIPGHRIVREPEPATTFKPGEGDMFFVDDTDDPALPRVEVKWTTHRGEHKDLRLLLGIV